MHPNKAKSFPAATVPAEAKLGHRRRGKRGTRSEERRNARRAHASKQKCRRWRRRGEVGVPYPIRRKNEGKNLGRKHLELSEKKMKFVSPRTILAEHTAKDRKGCSLSSVITRSSFSVLAPWQHLFHRTSFIILDTLRGDASAAPSPYIRGATWVRDRYRRVWCHAGFQHK